jgi:hypothetical protein
MDSIIYYNIIIIKFNLMYVCLNVQDGSDCDCWVVGRFLSAKEQAIAPPGTTFHQFVVPPLEELRKDCRFFFFCVSLLPHC